MSTPVLDDDARATLACNDRYRLAQVDGIIAVAPPGVLTPEDEQLSFGRSVGRWCNRFVLGWLVLPFLRFNERLIGWRCAPGAILDRDELGCLDQLEAQWPVIRGEVDELVAAAEDLPPISTFVPDLAEAKEIIGGRGGSWHGFPIIDPKGWWIEENVERCPRTAEVLRGLPGLQTALFSVFAPHTIRPPHQGPNKGQVTIHLGVIVPEPRGSCAIEAGGEAATFQEGVAFAFDDTNTHTTWNEGDGPRVSLLVQVSRPVPWPASWTNPLAQRLFQIFSYPRGGWGRLIRAARPTLESAD